MRVLQLYQIKIKKEKGHVFITALIILAFGSLVIGPLMGYIGSGLIAGKTFESQTIEVYSADAGIEDAIWQLQNAGEGIIDIDLSTYESTDKMGLPIGEFQYINPETGDTETGTDPERNYLLHNLDENVINNKTVLVNITFINGSLYYIKSQTIKFELDEDGVKTHQVAKTIEVYAAYLPGGVAYGGLGGTFGDPQQARSADMKALAVIDTDKLIFTGGSSALTFSGWNEEVGEHENFSPTDLWLVNMSTGTSTMFLDNNDLDLGGTDIAGVHYSHISGEDYLYLAFKTGGSIKGLSFTTGDIVKLPITLNTDDEDLPFVESTGQPSMHHSIPKVSISSFTMRDNGNILISFFDNKPKVGGVEYSNGQVIEYQTSSNSYILEPIFDVRTGFFTADISNLVIDAMAVSKDINGNETSDILLGFSADVTYIYTDSETGEEIETEIQNRDIAIWNETDNTIKLHIGMAGQDFLAIPTYHVLLRSYDIN